MSDTRANEIEANLKAFLEKLPSIPTSNQGKFALLRHGDIQGFYDSAADAVQTGNALFMDKLFSIQQVTLTPVDLGYYSHAVSLWPT